MRHKHNWMPYVKNKCKLCGPFEVEKGRGDLSLLQARRTCKMLGLRTRIMYGPFEVPNTYISQCAGPWKRLLIILLFSFTSQQDLSPLPIPTSDRLHYLQPTHFLFWITSLSTKPILSPWQRRQYVLPKHQCLPTITLHIKTPKSILHKLILLHIITCKTMHHHMALHNAASSTTGHFQLPI
jgi:hypothetical protein